MLYRIQFSIKSLTLLFVGFSVDIALDLLMDESFNELRATIYATDDERKRFRQLGKSWRVMDGTWLLQCFTWILCV